MERRSEVPGNNLGEFLGDPGHPKTGPLVPRTIADDEHATGRHTRGEVAQERPLNVDRQVMKNVKERDVAAERRKIAPDIMITDFKIVVAVLSDGRSVIDFSDVGVEPEDRMPATAFAQIQAE